MNTQEIAAGLEAFPELKAKVERLLEVALDASDIELADEAEAVLLKNAPQLNQAALQAWAETQANKQSAQFSARHKKARKDVKKNSSGTVASETSK